VRTKAGGRFWISPVGRGGDHAKVGAHADRAGVPRRGLVVDVDALRLM